LIPCLNNQPNASQPSRIQHQDPALQLTDASSDSNIVSEREAEAQQMLLTSTDSDEIQLVCSFTPFNEPNTLLKILSKRLLATLDGILKSLPAKKHDGTAHDACNGDESNLRLPRQRKYQTHAKICIILPTADKNNTMYSCCNFDLQHRLAVHTATPTHAGSLAHHISNIRIDHVSLSSLL
jgi:hypothetical protein